ncbi:MAG: CinA family protein [Pseudomonadota bacterium]
MFDETLLTSARDLVTAATAKSLKIATAESCTGGLITGLLTEVAGSSAVVDRGFVTYSNAAKTAVLDIPADLIAADGAVSEAVAIAMVAGALSHADADIAVAVTGVAGPGGGSSQKPVGTVHMAAQRRERTPVHRLRHYGDLGRSGVRRATIIDAVAMMRLLVDTA